MNRECRQRRDPLLKIVPQPGERTGGDLNPARRRHEARPLEHQHQGKTGIVAHLCQRKNRVWIESPCRGGGIPAFCRHQQPTGGEEIERLRHWRRQHSRACREHAAVVEAGAHVPPIDAETRQLRSQPDRAPLRRECAGEELGQIGHPL